MKKFTIFLLSSLALASCSDDKNTPASPIAEKTYDASSGLELYYNGAVMPGKSVTFAQDGTKAEITAFSEFDLSQLSALGLSGKIQAPGVVPGSPKLLLNTDVAAADGTWTFAGTSQNDFCKFAYSGVATDSKLKLFINDAVLNAPVSPEVWKPAPIEKNSDGTFKSLPFYIDWQYTPLPDVDIDFSAVLSALTTLPVIPVYNNTAYMSVSEALTEVLRTVAFRPDGNIIFTYISTSFGAARIAQTEPNGYQYVVDSPGSVRLYINPLSFFSLLLNNTSGGTPEADIDLNDHGLFPAKKAASGNDDGSGSMLDSEMVKNILKSAMEALLPQLATGFPLSFDVTADGMHLYIDTATTVTLLNKILLPVLQDTSTVKTILAYIESDPSLSPLLPEIEKALPLIPKLFEQTNTLRLGFTFVPYTDGK
ncbi:MAG: hypothetical protein HDR88_05605 [Bacteroides sp.]|nr:hypothetical protein [Bacteroides sp.]